MPMLDAFLGNSKLTRISLFILLARCLCGMQKRQHSDARTARAGEPVNPLGVESGLPYLCLWKGVA